MTTNTTHLEICTSCAKPYCRSTEESYKTSCLPCFKRSKGWTLNQSDRALMELQEAFERYKVMQNRRKRKRVVLKTPNKEALPIRDLMILCHPDKHNGSQKATETFKKLAALKDKK